jgi:electron transport complex protein RnfG
MSTSSVKKDFVMPIVVLTVICLVITAALAITNSFTQPVIEEAAAERAQAARAEIIPEAEDFVLMELEGLPATITEVYKTTNDVGYIFMITTTGYGGEMDLICGIDQQGCIISVKTLSHSETKGMGSKTTEEPFRSQFVGKDSSLDGVEAISGATISSTAYINAINDAFTAWNIAKEAS